MEEVRNHFIFATGPSGVLPVGAGITWSVPFPGLGFARAREQG